MNIDPILKALAAALAGEGPAVRLLPSVVEWQPPAIELIADAHPALDGGTIAVVVSTSGSTGKPKQTLLSLEALGASSMATAMALGGEGQWLLALPPHYVAGIQVLVRSLFAGTRPEVMDRSAGFTPEAFTAAAQEMTDPVRYTSLVPTQLQRLLEDPSAATLDVLRRFNAVLLGGSPAGAELLSAARAAGVRVVTTYGMSETCGGCVYDGVPLEGVQAQVRDGRIWLGGDVVASGYRDAPSLTGRSFTLEETPDGPVRWYRTDDRGELSADGRLTVFGRVDDVILTGGLKVSATLVADQLKLVDGVTDAFVLGLPDKRWGQRVSAAVVGTCTLDELRVGAAAVLATYAVPKTVLFMPKIPMLPTGKPDRQKLATLLEAGGTGLGKHWRHQLPE